MGDTRISSFLSGIPVGILICWGLLHIMKLEENSIQPQIKPCKCLTLQETLLYVAKTERFVDELQKAKKGKRNQLIDSINHYRTLLKSEGNEIQY